MPYVRAWAEKYRDQGLVVIGVHTPEFPFEHDIDNVRRAVKAMNLPYPVAVDSDYAIWHGFNNHYWPALYFVDAQGRVRHQQFGEGEYAAGGKVHSAVARVRPAPPVSRGTSSRSRAAVSRHLRLGGSEVGRKLCRL